jgi:hypothetical protein
MMELTDIRKDMQIWILATSSADTCQGIVSFTEGKYFAGDSPFVASLWSFFKALSTKSMILYPLVRA